ncbi:MAG: hypothetical protein A3C27_01680 [Candidatus Levybacteria bacterium RIFCSPHIGHO2_02_FULL_39_36]|nr:MAG: NAD-dependent epimerase/dehydratase [Candidatus Levybacteria bacterium GW2011_GWA1_39_11]KKR25039.1 MAG: NAD-dependent epimerase/dehydratase [Candidatus Levybacteria bacterium GW2011_GWB1_39_7]KKR26959.1 MAG: NAD-dependent epimerase/dehydratase [Microgenomates group bacterium GW2011_GWC1_39_7]OGH15371.1 MAG: hypothetical protein A2689_02165 [Candidatus Levybacteria bacterium RIFCSPHIGHO2_01_FULL_38_96]OGH27576.1 MAG: hypothetical protein A3C27_01680 [Candidatus Levybacteria bacterium RI
MRKTVLITGAAGFIGSHIVDKFISNNYHVVAVDNLKTGNKRNINSRAEYYNVDLNRAVDVKKMLKKYKPTQIIHHASNLVDVELSVKNPSRAYKDVPMTINLLEEAVRNGLEHFIFSSSANIYGNKLKTAAKESYEDDPSSPYGLTKQAIEKFIKYASSRYNFKHTILRYFNVYGERQNINSQAAIPTFIKQLIIGQPLQIRGGNQLRDFVYVGDVAVANLLAAQAKKNFTFNIGSGKQVELKSLVMLITSIMGKKPTIQYIDREAADSFYSGGIITKAKRELGWRPQTSLKKGLTQTIDYYLKLVKR